MLLHDTLGRVNSDDIDYCNRELVRGVEGQATADKSFGGMIIAGIIEIIILMVLSETTDIDKTFLLMLAFYAIVKNGIVAGIFSKISSDNLIAKKEWNDDKRKLAATKICLAKMGELKSDVDLDDLELRNRSKLDDLDIRNFI